MQFKAEQKYLLLSPRKVRPVVDLIKGMNPVFAMDVLLQVNKRAAEPLRKVIGSALASAKIKGVSGESLVFGEIQINEGPRLRRGIAVSRGMWHPIKKRMSHIRVVLTEKTLELKKEVKKVDTKKVEVKKEVETKKVNTKKVESEKK